VDRFESLLAVDEAARAARFRYEEHRRAFAVARGPFASCSAGILGAAPARVQFRHGTTASRRRCRASTSISARRTPRVGDVRVRAEMRTRPRCGEDPSDAGCCRIANAYFTAEEAASLASTPADEGAFFRHWVCKEAYVKATGEGLNRPLNGFGLRFRHGDSVVLEPASGEGERTTTGWMLQLLEPPAGYAAALAYRGGRRPVAAWPVLTAAELLSTDR